MSQGKAPGRRILSLIQRAENVSPSWLVDSIGQPFMTHRVESDREAAQYLEKLLSDERWTVYVLTDGHRAALVLEQPAEIEHRGKRTEYRAVEVVTGPLSSDTLYIINIRDRDVQYRVISEHEMSRLWAGEIGTWKLFGDENTPGLLSDSETLERFLINDDLYPEVTRAAVRERNSVYHDDILSLYHRLSDHDQETVRMIIQTLLDRDGR